MLCVSCGVSIRDDLDEYINRSIANASVYEDTAMEAYGAVTGVNYSTEDALMRALEETVIPNYRKYLGLLEQIDPKTDSVKALHKLLMEGSRAQMESFSLSLEGLRSQNQDLILNANRQMSDSRIKLRAYLARLDVLMQETGVKARNY